MVAPEPIAAGLVATDDAGGLGSSKTLLGPTIPSCRRWIAPAGILRSRGRCAAPVVKPSFRILTPSSKASNRGG
jgi:hypothetical protein